MPCRRCECGYKKKDSTHDPGCPNRWLTLGERFDELSYDGKWDEYALQRSLGLTVARTLEEYSASLYRPKFLRQKRKEMLDAHTSTIQDAKNLINSKILEGSRCPCCSQKVKAKPQTIDYKQALALIFLYKTFPVGTLVDVNYFVSRVQPPDLGEMLSKGRDWTQLKYWGLLQTAEDDKKIAKAFRKAYPDSKGKRLSLHYLVDPGAQFVQGAPVYKDAYVFEDTVYGYSQDTLTLQEILAANNANLQALWNHEVAAVGHLVM